MEQEITYRLYVQIECIEQDATARRILRDTLIERRLLPTACREYPTLESARESLDTILGAIGRNGSVLHAS